MDCISYPRLLVASTLNRRLRLEIWDRRIRWRTPGGCSSPFGKPLVELVYLRMSQINGYAFCLGMHAAVLRAGGIRAMIWLLTKR